MNTIAPVTSDMTAQYVLGQSLGTDLWLYQANPSGGFTATKVDMFANPTLVAAVIVSLVLAALAALGVSVVAVLLAREIRNRFIGFAHTQERVHNLTKACDGTGEDADKLAAIQKPVSELPRVYEKVFGYFALVEWIYVYVKPKMFHSLDLFLADCCDVAAPSGEPDFRERLARLPFMSWVRAKATGTAQHKVCASVRDFMARYTTYCQRHGYGVLSLDDNADHLEAVHGVVLQTESVPTLVGIRFRDPDHEAHPTGLTRERFGGNCTHWFVAERCVTSSLEGDAIVSEEFEEALRTFNEEHNVDRWDYSPADLAALGVTLEVAKERRVLSGLKLRDRGVSVARRVAPDDAAAVGRVARWWKRNQAALRTSKRLVARAVVALGDFCERVARVVLAEDRVPFWWIFEFMLVVVQACLVMLPPVPIVLLVVWVQSIFTNTSASAIDSSTNYITLSDLQNQPWVLASKALMTQVCVALRAAQGAGARVFLSPQPARAECYRGGRLLLALCCRCLPGPHRSVPAPSARRTAVALHAPAEREVRWQGRLLVP